MNGIIIDNPCTKSFSSQFASFFNVFSKVKLGDANHFDLSQIEEIFPLLILPLAVYIHDTNSSFELPVDKKVIEQYSFPDGDRAVNIKKEVRFPILYLSNSGDIKQRDELISQYIDMIFKKLSFESKNILSYPISEFINNIFEHSKKNEGWIFAKIDKTTKFIDICIVDSGRGLKMSYQEEENIRLSHLDAIGEVMLGHSTKKDKDRGYGVWTSKRLICKGLKGNFLLMSGNAILIAEGMDEKVLELDKDIWNGVVLAYRIPIKVEGVSLYDYVE